MALSDLYIESASGVAVVDVVDGIARGIAPTDVVVIQPAPVQLAVGQDVAVVEILSPGPQGPPGPPYEPYNFIRKTDDPGYTYYGFSSGSAWKIKRKEVTTGIWSSASGSGDFSAAWANRAGWGYS